jgi:fatty acid amide hydrolase 2
MKGLNFSAGQVLRKNIKAKEDAEVVKRMREIGGAIPICVTVTSELGFWFESSNHVYGRSKNPYDQRRMIGGSSGGEGALISACGGLVGIGSDIGGSIRMPAVFNGIFGHKPSNGLISNVGVYPPLTEFQNFMCTNGPLTRYAEDLDSVLDVLLDDENRLKLVNYDNVSVCRA